MRDRREVGLALAIALAIAIVLRLGTTLATGERELRGDEGYYVGVATEIHQHGEHPGAFRPPGYPAFVAAVLSVSGGRLAAVRWAQVAVSLLVVLVVFDIARRRFGPAPALVSALLCASSPTLIHYTQIFWSETLVTTALCGFVWSFDRFDRSGRRSWAAFAGVALGIAALTREMYLYFAPVAAAAVAVAQRGESRRRLAAAAILLGCCVTVVVPWVVRNFAAYGHAALSTNRWHAIALGNLPARDGSLLGVTNERPLIAAYKRIDDPLAAEDMARRTALKLIAEQQPMWLVRKALRTPYFLFAPVSQLTRFVERGWILRGQPFVGRALVRLEQAHYVILMLLGLAGLWLAPGGRTQAVVAALIVFQVAIYTVANANHRFRVPMLPFFALYAGPIAFGRIAVGASRRLRLTGAIATAVAFVLIVAAGGELHVGARRSSSDAVGDGEER